MTTPNTAFYAQSQLCDLATRSTANAGDYSGATTQTLSVGAIALPGSIVDRINVACRGSSSQNAVRFFVKSGGVAYFQFEIPIPARTVVPGANPAFNVEVPCLIPLPTPSTSLEFNTETADAVAVTAKGVDYS